MPSPPCALSRVAAARRPRGIPVRAAPKPAKKEGAPRSSKGAPAAARRRPGRAASAGASRSAAS